MAQSILLEGLITEPDDWWFPSQGEFDCLTELATATDATNVVAAMSSDSSDPQDIGIVEEFIPGAFLCAPDWLVASAEIEADDDQGECLRDLIPDLEADLLGAMLGGNEYTEDDLDAMVEFRTAWDVCMSRHNNPADPPPPAPSPATPWPTATATPLSDDHAKFLADVTSKKGGVCSGNAGLGLGGADSTTTIAR